MKFLASKLLNNIKYLSFSRRVMKSPRRGWLGMAVVAGMVGLVPVASASCVGTAPLRGINMAGAEFNAKILPGVMFKNYTFPGANDINYFADQGANMIRLPLRWERVQPKLNGALDAAYVKMIKGVVDVAAKRDMCVLLDIHNYGLYNADLLGSAAVPNTAFLDLWKRLAVAFPDVDHTALGLMNEPAALTLLAWGAAAQQTVTGLRAAGDKHMIFVGGAVWNGAADFLKARTPAGDSSGSVLATLKDPLGRTIFEVHQYVDSNYSGTKADCVAPTKAAAILDNVKTWATANNKRVFLGEFGVADSAACLPTLRAMLDAMHDQRWAGWTFWSAGAWWPQSYMFNIQPGVTHGQTEMMKTEWVANKR